MNESSDHRSNPKNMISLRPTPSFSLHSDLKNIDDTDFVFSREPIIISENERVIIPMDCYSGDETDEEDHETRIQSSWHHRALLGDENRILYTDGQDTDWDSLMNNDEIAHAHDE